MEIKVECYAGYRGEETPRRLIIGQCTTAVVSVQDRWLAPDHRYFKVAGEDGGLYLIRHDPRRDAWELTGYWAHTTTIPPVAEPGNHFHYPPRRSMDIV